MIDDTPTLTFAKSSYHLETEEAERVSVDQVSHARSTAPHSPPETRARARTLHVDLPVLPTCLVFAPGYSPALPSCDSRAGCTAAGRSRICCPLGLRRRRRLCRRTWRQCTQLSRCSRKGAAAAAFRRALVQRQNLAIASAQSAAAATPAPLCCRTITLSSATRCIFALPSFAPCTM